MSTTKAMILATLAVVTVLGLGYALVVRPNYQRAASLRTQAAQLHQKVMHLAAMTEDVERLADEASAARQRVDRDLKLIPDSADIAGLIRKLSQSVDRIRVLNQTFNAGSPGEALPGGKSLIEATPLTIDIEASFDSIFALIQNAESINRLLRISSVRMSCKRDEAAPTRAPMVKATVVLEAIYEPPVAQAIPLSGTRRAALEER
ncbi:MAG: type 4a pilus biogenesis protein PilO [Phycisphaerales bacterium]|nr:type 4a pilus biogenesis protein PilO [Phycisphaerales bacterium]